MSYFIKRTEENLWHGKFSSFPDDLIVHAISTRIGGYSEKPFDSLSLALHVGDNAENVLANRKKFFQSLGYNFKEMVTPNQIHGDKVFKVEEIHRGRGSQDYSDSIPETDALITNVKNLPLMLCFADCVPIMFDVCGRGKLRGRNCARRLEGYNEKNCGENFSGNERKFRYGG